VTNFVKGLDISYSALSPAWAAVAYSQGYKVLAVDLWTGGLANDPILHNQSGPSLLAGIGASLIPVGYVNANPQAWGDAGATWEAPSAVAHAIANAGAAWPVLLASGFIAVDVEIVGTTWARVQAIVDELIRVGVPTEHIFIYTGGWFIPNIGNPPSAILMRFLWTTGGLATFTAAPYGGWLPGQVIGCQLGETTTDGVQYDYDVFDLDWFRQGVPVGPTTPQGESDMTDKDIIALCADALTKNPEGAYVRGDGTAAVYKIIRGRRVWLDDAAIAADQGMKADFSNVSVINPVALLAWPEGIEL
jgi:hypothetical protein